MDLVPTVDEEEEEESPAASGRVGRVDSSGTDIGSGGGNRRGCDTALPRVFAFEDCAAAESTPLGAMYWRMRGSGYSLPMRLEGSSDKHRWIKFLPRRAVTRGDSLGLCSGNEV